MSTPNPLAPQGSLLEKQGRGRSTVQIISFIGALHVFVLCALLWIGCKQDKPAAGPDAALPGQEATLPPVTDPLPVDPAPTNVVVAPPTNPPVALIPVAPLPGGTSAPPVTSPGSTGLTPPITPPVTPVPEAGAVAGGAATEHKVAARETGVTIAKKYGLTLAALKAANPNVNWNKLKVGQALSIPAAAPKAAEAAPLAPAGSAGGGGTAEGLTHTVRAGETGSKIAKKYGVSWRKIRDLNGLTSDALKVNQKLSIPAKGAPAGAATEPGSAAPAAEAVAPLVAPLPAAGGR